MASITNPNIHIFAAPALPAAPSDAAVETSRALYDKAMAHMAEADRWRLFIDLSRQDQGGDSFDVAEPGYRQGMENGLKYVRDKLGVNFNAAELRTLHDICIDGVFCDPGRKIRFQKGYHFNLGYPIKRSAVTPASEDEWRTEHLVCEDTEQTTDQDVTIDKLPLTCKISIGSPPKECLINTYTYELLFKVEPPLLQDPANPDKTQHSLFEQVRKRLQEHEWENTIATMIDLMFETYYKSMEAAQTENEKLGHIVTLCRSLSMWHGFSDANQRTIAFALLPKLLIENKFSPAILEEPAMFDGYFSRSEMIQFLIEGMERFQKFN